MCFKRYCRVLLNIALAIGILIPSGCASNQAAKKHNDRITIGFSMDTLKEERWYKDQNDFIKEGKKLNADVIVDVAYEDSSRQLEQVKDMVSKGIDVLVIIPHDVKDAATAVNYAQKKGVKVILYDRLVENVNADLYISFDNEKVGELQADSLLASVGKGNYVIINGPASDHNSVMINNGIMKVLNPYTKTGKVKIVKQIQANDWMADEAYNCIIRLINDDVGINAVIAANDSLAGGAIDALSESKMISSVPVVGMDADLAACQRVVEGQQMMTVYKPIDKLAAAAVDMAVKFAKNEKLTVEDKISDGKYTIPYYKIEPVAVFKRNIDDTVIKDGFHSLNDVYMNVPKSQWPSH